MNQQPSKESATKKTGVQKSENISLPKSTSAPDFAKNPSSPSDEPLKAPQKKKLRRLHHIPVTTLPEEDEALDEALDEIIEDDSMLEEIPVDAPEEIAPTLPRSQNPFSRLKERRARSSQENAAVSEVVRKKNGFSEDDIAMMFELGYDGELGRMIGYENLKKLKLDYTRKQSLSQHRHYRTSFGYRGTEDINETTRDGILAAYAHDRKILIRRTLLTLLATVLLLFLDMPSLIGGVFLQFSIDYPIWLPLFSLLILVGTAFLSFRQINAGIRSYFRLKPTPYSSLAILFPLTIIYDIASFFTSFPLLHVNFIVALVLLILALCDVMRLLCEMRTLRLLTLEGVKTVLEPTVPRKKKLRRGKKLVKIINDDIDESFYRVQSTYETTGFFRRFNDMSDSHRTFHILLGAAPGAAFVSAFITLLATESVAMACSLFMNVLAIAAPIGSIFGFFYPLCRANRLLSRYNCALIGEEAVKEFAKSKTVIFSDTDLYSAQKCTEIAIRESDDFRRDLRLAGILFRKIGGTLTEVGNAYGAKIPDPPVAFVRIADFGVEAVVDNQYHMIAGSAEFLKKCGIRIPRESSDKILRRTPNVSVMYVAIDGTLRISYEVEYTVKPEFLTLAGDLCDIDTAIAVQSYDPNLNEIFVQNSRTDAGAPDGGVPIRVIKPGKYEPDSVCAVSDTGAVALGEAEDIVYPLHASRGASSIKTFARRLSWILSTIGILAVTILSPILGSDLGLYLTPFSIGAYHLLSMLVVYISSHIYLNRRTLRLRHGRDHKE